MWRKQMAESAADGSSSSKSLLWMMIAVFIGLSGLLGGGLFLANRMVRSMGLAAATSKGTIRTPAGSFRLEKQGEVGPGLPVYPNAAMVLPTDKATSLAIEERRAGISTVTYQTRDTRGSVDLWYSQHLGPEFARHDSGEKPLPEVFRDARVSDSDIAFLAQRGRQVRIVALSLDATGTSISLLRFDKSPGQ
jgi:hypothetical protein